MGNYQPIGEMLVRKGKITPEQLEAALRRRSTTRRRIGEVLIAMGFASEWDVAECLAEQFGFDVVDPSKVTTDPTALQLLSGEVALAHRILPIRYSGDCVECVMADPIDFPTTDMISRLAGRRAVLHIAPASALVGSIQRAYGIDAESLDVRKCLRAKRSAPKPQRDREAILAQLDAAHGTKEPTPTMATLQQAQGLAGGRLRSQRPSGTNASDCAKGE